MEKFNFHNEAVEEKTRIYEDPSQDPAYQEFEKRILEKTNTDEQVRQAVQKGSTNYSEIWSRVNFRISMHDWAVFAISYPEKATAYAKKNSLIESALPFLGKADEAAGDATQQEPEEDIQIAKYEPTPIFIAYMDASKRLQEVNLDAFDHLMRFTSEEKDPVKIKQYADTQDLTSEEKHFLDATYHLRLEGKKN